MLDTLVRANGVCWCEHVSTLEPAYDILVLRFRPKKTAVFGCLTYALARLPISLESCSRAQTDWPVE